MSGNAFVSLAGNASEITGSESDTLRLLNAGNVSPLRPATSVTDNKRTALPFTRGTSCLICETTEGRLVTDHNHVTEMIRGTLCELCNSWLGVYEKNLCRKRQRGRRLYRAWVLRYKSQIHDHLQRDTGINYHENLRAINQYRRKSSLGMEMGS